MDTRASRTGRIAALLATVVLSAPPARAQEADPIGALLEQTQIPPPPEPATPAPQPPAQAPAVETPPAAPPSATPPAAYAPPPVYSRPPVQAPYAPPPAYTPPPYTPPVYTPPPYTPPYVPPARRPRLTAPVHIDEIGKTPEGPPTATDLNYEARMRSSFNSAQGMQGPLDGAWSLRSGGSELYDLQLVDTGSGSLEGAWRDPRRRGAVDASGFIDSISRVGGQLTIRITPRPGAEPSIVLLSAGADGSWSGELNERGEHRSVTLRRN